MESWICGVPSLALRCGNDYARHLWEDGICPLCEDPEDLMRLIQQQIALTEEERYNHARKIWGADLGRYYPERTRKVFREIGILKD